jgi:hypothetical protein
MPRISEEAQRKIQNLINRFKYKYDSKVDSWRILEMDESGHYRGDCDDFAVTVWWYVCGESYWKFWTGILLFKAKFWRCLTEKDYIGHLVLEYDGEAIDNIYLKWLKKDEMSHHFSGYLINNILMVAIKMLLGKIFK